MIVGSPTKLNLIPAGVMPVVYINQGDAGYDKEFLVYNGDSPYNVPAGVSATIRGTKADGYGVTEAAALTEGSNLVTVTITEQMVAAEGSNLYELVFVDTDGLRIATINMVWSVKADALGDSVISDSDLDYATTVMDELQSVQAFKNQLDTNSRNIRQNTDGLAAETAARIAADNTLQTNINAEASTRSTQDALLQTQINQIIAPTGTAPSAAEVENARIGANGVTYSTLGEAIRTLDRDLANALSYGTDMTLQRSKSDANKAWGDTRFDIISYVGEVITLTNNGSVYILVEPRDANNTAIATAIRINPSKTASMIVSVIPDHYIVYCDTYPINVHITSDSVATYLENKMSGIESNYNDFAINYLDGKICYANLSDFNLNQNQYYANDLTPSTPTDGNTYHIAEPFVVPAGTYSFYGIDSYWSFHVLLDGTKTRFASGDPSGTFTVSQPATLYLTTRTNITGYANANVVSGSDIYSVAPDKGYFSEKIEQIDGFTQVMASVNMFNSVAALGDSYTAASVKNSGGTWGDYPNNSWVATMCKRSGVDWFNYGVGGATVKSYANSSKFNNQVLTDTAKDIYFICLGINDFWQTVTLGTIADINDADYTQNPDSFYGWYGRIIARLTAHAPTARIVLIRPWTYDACMSVYGDAVAEIAAHYNIPCINPYDDIMFYGGYFETYHNSGHPTLMGYDMMGVAMERLFSEAVLDNMAYFKFSTVG